MPDYHARFGGSNAKRWINCTGYLHLAPSCPVPPTNRAAMEGTAQHTCMERMLLNPEIEPRQFLGAVIDSVEITPEHVAAMEKANAAVDAILSTFPEDAELYAERFLVFDIGEGTEDEPEAGGSADLIIVSGTRAAVCDFKFGQIEVEATSEQNRFYMAAALRSFPPLANAETFEGYLIQPAYDPVTVSATYTRAEIETAQMEFDTAIYLNNNSPPRYIEGEHCAYCPAAIRCPAKTERLQSLMAAGDVSGLQALSDFWTSFLAVWEASQAVRRQIHHELEHGVEVPGFKLVARRVEDQWRDEAEAFLRLTAAGYPQSQIMRLRSPHELASIIPPDVLAPLIHRPPGGTTIAPVTDRRPAVVPPGALGAALRRLAR
jgi:hypothetical protein